MSTSSHQLSVLVHTKNAASTLATCLASVTDLKAEVIVMDMFSTDSTLAIARKFKARILHSDKDYGYVEPARNQAIKAAKGDWILILDADEALTSTAVELIKKIVAGIDLLPEKLVIDGQPFLAADAYWIPRQNIIWQHPMAKTGWWPDFQLRLFKKGTLTWESKIHAQPKLTGTQFHWPADPAYAIIHQNYQTVEQFLDRMNRYTTQEVNGVVSDKWQVENTTAPLVPSDLIKSFRQEWFSRLFLHGGIDEGIHGVGLAQLQSMYQVIVLLKQWQAAGFPTKDKADSLETQAMLKELRQFNSDLRYWLAYWHIKKVPGLKKIYWMIRRKLKI